MLISLAWEIRNNRQGSSAVIWGFYPSLGSVDLQS